MVGVSVSSRNIVFRHVLRTAYRLVQSQNGGCVLRFYISFDFSLVWAILMATLLKEFTSIQFKNHFTHFTRGSR